MQNNRLLHLIKALWSLCSLTHECSLMEPQTSRQCTAAMAQKHNSMWVKWLKKHLCNFRCLEQKTSTRRKDKKQHQGIVISQLAGTAAVKPQKVTVEVSLTRLEQEAEFGGSGLSGTSRRRGPMADVHQRKLEMKGAQFSESVWLGDDSVISSPGTLFHFSKNGKNNYEYFRTSNKQVKD